MRTKLATGLLGTAVVGVLGLRVGADVETVSAPAAPPAEAPHEQQSQDQTEMGPEDRKIATLERPAVLTLTPATIPPSADPGKAGYVVLNVLGFTPPAEGSVTAVVKLRDEAGSEQVLGSFGLFPAIAEFKAETAEDAQRFVFRLPEDKVRALENTTLQLSVELVPSAETTSPNASFEFGDVEFQQ